MTSTSQSPDTQQPSSGTGKTTSASHEAVEAEARRDRPLTAGPDAGPEAPYPIRLDGRVVKGFGRGSSELGIPTANIPLSGLAVGGHTDIESGVYFGWAGLSPSKATHQHPPGTDSEYKLMARHIYDSVVSAAFRAESESMGSKEAPTQDKGAVYPMVMSIGWNPFYKNEVRSVEVHIMHHFQTDFYGSHMNLDILGFIRPELDYVSKEKLIEDIKTDIDVAGRSLARKSYAKFKNDQYLLEFEGKEDVAT